MDDQKIDDIVAMLDQFMSENGGHMNIQVTDDGEIHTETTTAKTVSTMNCLDCAAGDMACQIPNLLDGLDQNADDE